MYRVSNAVLIFCFLMIRRPPRYTRPDTRSPSPTLFRSLAPLAEDSVWTPRFEAAASELADALRSRDEARWGPLLGGKWLAAADCERIRGDRKSTRLNSSH